MSEKKVESDLASFDGIDETQFTSEQLGVMREGKRMIGKVLTIVEAAIPEGRQLISTKRLVQNAMYDGLKAILGELE